MAIENVDWQDLHKRLMIYARFLLSPRRSIHTFSVEDLVQETHFRLLAGALESWRRDPRSSLFLFACGIMRNAYWQRLRREWRQAGSVDDPDFRPPRAPSGRNPEPLTFADLSRRVSDDPVMTDLVNMLQKIDFDRGHLAEQLASLMGIKKRRARDLLERLRIKVRGEL